MDPRLRQDLRQHLYVPAHRNIVPQGIKLLYSQIHYQQGLSISTHEDRVPFVDDIRGGAGQPQNKIQGIGESSPRLTSDSSRHLNNTLRIAE